VNLADEVGINRRTLWRQAYLRWILRLGAFTDFTGMPENDLNEDLLVIAAEVAALAAHAPSDEEKDKEPDETATADDSPDFDGLPLSSVVVRLTEAVRASGEVAKEDLGAAFERVSGIEVPPERLEILSGIAWQGQALKYLAHEDTDGRTTWRPGSVLPAPDRRWRNWSITSFKEHVAGLNGRGDTNTLCSELFSGRAGQTVKRVVRAAMHETPRG
jgi:hypothetical protein